MGAGGPADDEEHAARAASFGEVAIDYGRYRPGYAAEAVEWALRPILGRNPVRVLDLAAGTGRLTEAIQDQDVDVIGVEPDERMREEFLRRVGGVAVLNGSAEQIPLPDGRVDAVLAGQAFHWFDPARALPEIARVLSPGGVLAALWNLEDDRVPWVADYGRAAGDRTLYTGFRDELDGDEAARWHWVPRHPAFGPTEVGDFANPHSYTLESLVATHTTHSRFLVMPRHERQAHVDRMIATLRGTPGFPADPFELPMRTVVVRAVLA
jgi:SAM-dependent methyltransferase